MKRNIPISAMWNRATSRQRKSMLRFIGAREKDLPVWLGDTWTALDAPMREKLKRSWMENPKPKCNPRQKRRARKTYKTAWLLKNPKTGRWEVWAYDEPYNRRIASGKTKAEVKREARKQGFNVSEHPSWVKVWGGEKSNSQRRQRPAKKVRATRHAPVRRKVTPVRARRAKKNSGTVGVVPGIHPSGKRYGYSLRYSPPPSYITGPGGTAMWFKHKKDAAEKGRAEARYLGYEFIEPRGRGQLRRGRPNRGRKPARKNPLLQTVWAAAGNPPKKIPFRNGQKISVEKARAWVRSTGNRELMRELDESLKMATKANETPKYVTWKTIPIGSKKRIDMVTAMANYGETPETMYRAPKGSKKGKSMYVHSWGEKGGKKSVPLLAAAGGRALIMPLGKGKKAGDWLRG